MHMYNGERLDQPPPNIYQKPPINKDINPSKGAYSQMGVERVPQLILQDNFAGKVIDKVGVASKSDEISPLKKEKV